MSPGARFTVVQRRIHWAMAAAICAMLFVGVGMVSSVEPKYLPLVEFHEATGLVILVLAVIRIIVRLRNGAPPLPAGLPAIIKLAAVSSHYALYTLMISMPLIGWAMLSSAGYPVRIGAVVLPPIFPVNEEWHALLWKAHVSLGLGFFALLLLHLSAALFHAWIRKDGVFESMSIGPRG